MNAPVSASERQGRPKACWSKLSLFDSQYGNMLLRGGIGPVCRDLTCKDGRCEPSMDRGTNCGLVVAGEAGGSLEQGTKPIITQAFLHN